MKQTNESLKNCPFCNGEAAIDHNHVYCVKCGCMPGIFNPKKDSLVAHMKLWNQRPTPPAQIEHDLSVHGVHINKDGKRVDPNDFYKPEQVNLVPLDEKALAIFITERSFTGDKQFRTDFGQLWAKEICSKFGQPAQVSDKETKG